MSRNPTVNIDPAGRYAMQYVRSRRTLRLLSPGQADAPPVEVALPVLLKQLGVEATDLVPNRQYLLFAGTQESPGGGLDDLVGVYPSETEARRVFRGIRLAPESRHRWAELVALGSGGRLDPLCWFGRSSPTLGARDPDAPDVPPAEVDGAPARPGTVREWVRSLRKGSATEKSA